MTTRNPSSTRSSIGRKRRSPAIAMIPLTLLVSLAGGVGRVQAQEVTVELWTHEFEPLQTAMLEKWIPEFEEAFPDITVEMTTIPLAGAVTYDAKLLTSLASGEGPDLWDMGDWNYPSFGEAGYLLPLDPEIFGYTDDADFIAAYQPGSTTAIERDDQLVGAFSEFNTLNLFYNREVFADAGVPDLPTDTPVSWDQIGEISQQLRLEEGGIPTRIGYQYGFFASFTSPQWYAQNYYTLMRQYGQDDLYVDGEPAADSAAAIAAFQSIYDYTWTYEAYDPTFITNWFADVPQGRVGMVAAGTWFPAAALPNNPDFDFGVAPMPVVDPDDPETYKNISWLWGWSVNAASPEPDQLAAQQFIAFILGKKGETEQAAWWFENLGYLQPSVAFLESDAYATALEESPWLQLWVDAFDNYEIAPVQHSYDQAGAALARAIDRVIYDQMPAEETAAQLQAELERLG
jgi:ABC-type glycerol-3-phosphate transport system substrate-binding protein